MRKYQLAPVELSNTVSSPHDLHLTKTAWHGTFDHGGAEGSKVHDVMKDRYVPPYRIETAEQLVRVFSSWNHHAQSKGAWRLYSKEEIENTPSRRDGVSAYSERRYKRLLITLIWKVAEALAS